MSISVSSGPWEVDSRMIHGIDYWGVVNTVTGAWKKIGRVGGPGGRGRGINYYDKAKDEAIRRNRKAQKRRNPGGVGTKYTPGMFITEDVTRIVYQKYGPGKFSDNVEEFVYESDVQGWGETLGDEFFGTYGFVDYGRTITVVGAPLASGKISAEEWEFVAAIIFYRESGFVDVTTYDDLQEAKDDWKDLEQQYDKFIEEHEGEYEDY